MTHQAFGRYEIKQELGRGGMATVYHAYDPSFGREVAIKVLPHEFLHDATFRARFEREARTIAMLEHAAIVPVYDFGEQDGQPFLVMRFMPGGSLAERIAQGPIPLAEAARLIEQLAPALDDAHEHGVIHRDLKPGNILFDQKDNAFLSDFGIAKVAQETSALTGGGGIIGTPAYMSPEQGRGQPVDWRSDLYSLGVIVFQMLSGRLPYQADTPVGMIYAHVHDPIPSVREANPGLPPACANLVGRAMAKDAAERYQTAREMATDLNVALSAPVGTHHAVSLRTEPLPPAPSYAPTMDVVEPAPMPRAEKLPATPAPESARQGIPAWAWIGGVVVMVGVIAGGLALSGIFGGGATAPEPTQAPTLSVGERARQLAEAGITRNANWTPYTEEINGVLMALIPAGCFAMGGTPPQVEAAFQQCEQVLGAGSCDRAWFEDEQPLHEVCFEKPFWIDVYEVTQVQFAELGGEAGQASAFTGGRLPQESTAWTEADAFCRKRGARLPTEAEWEYAARGPDGLLYPWGNELIADNVVYGANSGSHTWDVGSKPGGVSWIGAYDLSGNVWEWVADWYGTYPSEQQVNPTGPGSGDTRVMRGGSWYYRVFLRAVHRGMGNPDLRSYDVGFRCGLALSGALGGGAEKTPEPTQQVAASAPATPTIPPATTSTPNPTATPDFSADFNDASFDGSFDSSQWAYQWDLSDISIKQASGAMVLSKPSISGMEVGSLKTNQTWSLGEFSYVEARLKLDQEHAGEMGTVGFSLGDVDCTVQIGTENTTPVIWCAQSHTDQAGQWISDYMSGSYFIEYDKWYTIRIEFNSQTKEFICYVDGKLFYSWQPANIDDLLRKEVFVSLDIWADNGTSITGYVDDVRVVK